MTQIATVETPFGRGLRRDLRAPEVRLRTRLRGVRRLRRHRRRRPGPGGQPHRGPARAEGGGGERAPQKMLRIVALVYLIAGGAVPGRIPGHHSPGRQRRRSRPWWAASALWPGILIAIAYDRHLRRQGRPALYHRAAVLSMHRLRAPAPGDAAPGGGGAVPPGLLRIVPHPGGAVRPGGAVHPELRLHVPCHPPLGRGGAAAGLGTVPGEPPAAARPTSHRHRLWPWRRTRA